MTRLERQLTKVLRKYPIVGATVTRLLVHPEFEGCEWWDLANALHALEKKGLVFYTKDYNPFSEYTKDCYWHAVPDRYFYSDEV